MSDSGEISTRSVVATIFVFFALVWLLVALVATIWLDALQSYIVGWIAVHAALFAMCVAGVRSRWRPGDE